MFSGIVEEAAQVVKLEKEKDNLHITMRCSFTGELKIDQSISHNGVCLTVVKKDKDTYTVTAIKETLEKTNLGLLKPGDKVNLERSTRLDGRLDGHMVQGISIRLPFVPMLKKRAEAGIIASNMNPPRMIISLSKKDRYPSTE